MGANTGSAGKGALEAIPLASLASDLRLHCLSKGQIQAIDDALLAVGDYGEVRLIKNRGKLRFIQTLRSRSFDESDQSQQREPS